MSAGEPDSKLPTIWTSIVFPTMWTSCCCQCCADLEDTVKVALRQGTVLLCHVDCRLQCAMLIAMCQADCRCTSCAAWWVTQPVPAEHNNCSLLSAHRWCALFETCSLVDIFLVNTTSMGNIFTWSCWGIPQPQVQRASLPSLEWDYFLLGLLCKLRRVTLGICQTPDEISHACCAKIYSKMRSQIITCRVVLTVPPDFQYPNENNLLSHWQISWKRGSGRLLLVFLFWYWKLGGP